MDPATVDLKQLALTVDYVNPRGLRKHEKTFPDRRDELVEFIKEQGLVDYPILVDEDFDVILDGHHRAAALVELDTSQAPVIRVDYFDPNKITVEPRPNCPIDPLTKKAILRMGLSEEVFPPKSTRHVLQFPEQRVDKQLEDLY